MSYRKKDYFNSFKKNAQINDVNIIKINFFSRRIREIFAELKN